MTIQIFSRDYMPVISGAIAFFGLLFIWIQLRTATKVIEQTSSWNRINSTYNFFNLENNTTIEKELYTAGSKLDINFMSQLTDDELNRLVNDNDCFLSAKEFLNDFESLCAAYQVGALDKELAFHMFGTRIVKEYEVFKPLIAWLRTRFDDQGILIEIQKTSREWKARLDSEKKVFEALANKTGATANNKL